MQIGNQTLILKNGWKKSFSYEAKASMSFITMSKMSFWFTIIKRKEIFMWLCVYPNWQTNFDSKKWCKQKLFIWNQNINSFILISRMSLWFLIMKRKEIIIWIHVYPNWQTNFDSKKWWKKKLFFWNQSINVVYPNKGNGFMVPNHEMKGHDYMNLCLSKLTNERWF